MRDPFRPIWVGWDEFVPALLHLRYWRAVMRIVLGGALIGALLAAVFGLAVGTYNRTFDRAAASWFFDGKGTVFLRVVLVFWLIGTVLYAAFRAWKRESEADEALIESFADWEINWGAERGWGELHACDARQVLATWGPLWIKPYGKLAWVRQIENDVHNAWVSNMVSAALRGAELAKQAPEATPDASLQLHDLVEELHLQGVIEPAPPTEDHPLVAGRFFSRGETFWLTERGRNLVLVARESAAPLPITVGTQDRAVVSP